MSCRAPSRRTFLVGAAVLLTASAASRAEPITDAPHQRTVKIALTDFISASSDAADLAHQITQTITDDLRSTGRFALIDRAAEPAIDLDRVPQFGVWRSLGTESLVVGRVKTIPDGRLRIEFRLWDIGAGQQMAGAQYFTMPEHWRQAGHVIAGAVYERLVGEARDFETGRD
jgi:TolB protein